MTRLFHVFGHRWHYRGLRVCPGCQRQHRVYACRLPGCDALRERRR